VPLATITLASTDSEIVFSSIPATYRDLVLVINGTTTSAAGISFTHNGDTNNANYSSVNMYGDGSLALSDTAANRNMISLFTQQSMGIVHFFDYSATDKHKTALARSSSANNELYALARRWANNNAINSIAVAGGTFNIGTIFSLYGIAS
jgi:hypothetical protein